MTTATAQNLAAPASDKKDEKPEKRRALGRGLESLLPGPRVVATTAVAPPAPRPAASPTVAREAEQSATAVAAIRAAAEDIETAQSAVEPVSRHTERISISAQAEPRDAVLNLAIESIEKNPYQTRYLFNEQEMVELRDSIQEHGVVQPVVVRPADQDGRYILVLGERRLRASKMAGKETIPALVRRLSPQQAAEMTVLENVVREDLNPIEQAEAYRVLSQQFNLTQAQIAQRIGVSRESVANYMRLLRLPRELKEYIALGRLGFSEARELLSLENPEHILIVAEELVRDNLKWDKLKERIAQLNGTLPRVPPAEQPGGVRWVDPNVRAAQTELEQLLGVRVKIKDHKGRGTIIIRYASVDDYERVIEMLRGGNKQLIAIT
ncbi:MAG: ParB/RepB/Spo0J family partition protein [Candidatus Sulfotelmatobacter sp.]